MGVFEFHPSFWFYWLAFYCREELSPSSEPGGGAWGELGEMGQGAPGPGEAMRSSPGVFFQTSPENKWAVKLTAMRCPGRQVWGQGHLWAHLGPISGPAASHGRPSSQDGRYPG